MGGAALCEAVVVGLAWACVADVVVDALASFEAGVAAVPAFDVELAAVVDAVDAALAAAGVVAAAAAGEVE